MPFFTTLSIYWPVENLLSNMRVEIYSVTRTPKRVYRFPQTRIARSLMQTFAFIKFKLHHTSTPKSLFFDLSVFFFFILIALSGFRKFKLCKKLIPRQWRVGKETVNTRLIPSPRQRAIDHTLSSPWDCHNVNFI